jgi:hypothetical protein
VGVSLTPLAMIRIDEPRTHDLFFAKPEKDSCRNRDSRCDLCELGNAGQVNDSAVDNSAVKASLEEGCQLIFFECDSCSQCDFCGKGTEAPKDLEKDKEIKCDLELSYDGLARPTSEKLLASVTIEFSKNSKFHKHSTCHEAVKTTGLQIC